MEVAAALLQGDLIELWRTPSEHETFQETN